MTARTVEDLMLPLDRYPRVSADATLRQALEALQRARQDVEPCAEPPRAVLALDEGGAVIGKLSLWGILRALDERLRTRDRVPPLVRTDKAAELLAAGAPGSHLFDGDFAARCQAAAEVPVRDVMLSARDSVGAGAPLGLAIERLVLHRAQSLLVIRGAQVVGVLRLGDVVDAVVNEVLGGAG